MSQGVLRWIPCHLCLADGGKQMKTKRSTFSRRLRAGVALRALAAAIGPTDNLRSGNKPGALGETRSSSRYLTAAFAALGLTVVAPTSPSHAQAPPLGTTANFAILSGAGITNTGPSVISGTPALPGDIGTSTATITGFPPGTVT